MPDETLLKNFFLAKLPLDPGSVARTLDMPSSPTTLHRTPTEELGSGTSDACPSPALQPLPQQGNVQVRHNAISQTLSEPTLGDSTQDDVAQHSVSITSIQASLRAQFTAKAIERNKHTRRAIVDQLVTLHGNCVSLGFPPTSLKVMCATLTRPLQTWL